MLDNSFDEFWTKYNNNLYSTDIYIHNNKNEKMKYNTEWMKDNIDVNKLSFEDYEESESAASDTESVKGSELKYVYEPEISASQFKNELDEELYISE